jgi:hypothetical protein
MQGLMEAILFIMQQSVVWTRQYCFFYLVVVRCHYSVATS